MKFVYRLQLVVVLIGLALVFAGCKSPTPRTGENANIDEEPGSSDVAATDVTSMGQDGMGSPEGQRLTSKDGFNYGKYESIHFDYDSAVIRSQDRAIVEKIAKDAKDNPELKIMVAGHCDERGTPEYNRALGQRRALAAREYMIKLGVPAKQVGTVSYGIDQPADTGHNEEAWSKNRRDEFGIGK